MAKNKSAVKQYSSKFWDAHFVFSNSFIPLVTLTIYCVLLAAYLPEGVNKVFTSRMWEYSLAGAALTGLLALALLPKKKHARSAARKLEKISRSDLVLLLLPLMPVVQYIIRNQNILNTEQAFLVIAIFMLFSSLLIFVIPKLLGRLASERTLMLLGAAFSFTILNMSSLSGQFSWLEQGSLKVQLPVLASIFIISWLAYDLGHKQVIYSLIAVLFISNSAVQLFSPSDITAAADTEIINETNRLSDSKLVQLIGDGNPLSTPSIYLLIYDAYPHNETLLSHGIDNHEQEEYLEDWGFTLYPQTYSVGASSLQTMSLVLDVSATYDGSRDAVAGGGVVPNLLRSFGYQTYGIFRSDYFFRGIQPSYDYSFPQSQMPALLLSDAILMGEFRFDAGFGKELVEEYRTTKRQVFTQESSQPIFLYTHSNFPGHSHNAGICQSDEVKLFRNRLAGANREMKDDLALLLQNEPEAIIIVAGDHGPWITKNCYATGGVYDITQITRLDIQDRYGTFLAIRWPTPDYEEFDDIMILQDLFPAIFAYLYNDPGILDARIEPTTIAPEWISGAQVVNSIIQGGADDGEPLFVDDQ